MAAKRTRTKKISVKEFVAWLGGVEEMQPDGWAPSTEQWQVIREKINTIDSKDVIKVPIAAPPSPQAAITYAQPVAQQPSSFAPPPAASNVVPAGPADPMMAAASTGGPIKTPDIDSTNGYESNFT